MTDEIKEIIQKHLPAQVGDTLKAVLEQGKKDAALVKELKAQIERAEHDIKIYSKTISEYKVYDERNSKIESKEKELAERERLLDIKILEYKLNNEIDKSRFCKDVALGLVRNSEYRKILSDDEKRHYYTDYNGKQTFDENIKNLTEVKTIE